MKLRRDNCQLVALRRSLITNILIALIIVSNTIQYVSSLGENDAPKFWCGTHSAETCEECGTLEIHCGGDCVWTNRKSATPRYPTMSEKEDSNSNSEFACRRRTIQCGHFVSEYNVALQCDDCTYLGKNYCTDPSCAWISSTSSCRPKLIDGVTRTAAVALLHDLHPTTADLNEQMSNSQDPLVSSISPTDADVSGQPAWFFQKLVITHAAESTFYGMNGHQYGYAGVQVFHNKDKEEGDWNGRIIFSLWDPDIVIDLSNLENEEQQIDVELVACGSLATCESNFEIIRREYQNDIAGELQSEDKEINEEAYVLNKKYGPLNLSTKDAKMSGYTASIEGIPIVTNIPYYFISQASVIVDETNNDEECDHLLDFNCDEIGSSWIEYSGYVSSKGSFGDSKWRLLATIRIRLMTPSQNNHSDRPTIKRDWWHHGLYSFIEQWAPQSSTQMREALFGPSFVSGVTLESDAAKSFRQILLSEYTFDTIKNHETVNAYYVNLPDSYDENEIHTAVGICTGGNPEEDIDLQSFQKAENGTTHNNSTDYTDDVIDAVQNNTEIMEPKESVKIRGKKRVDAWTRFNFPSQPMPYELSMFANYIPCLNSAENSKEIESCLEDESE